MDGPRYILVVSEMGVGCDWLETVLIGFLCGDDWFGPVGSGKLDIALILILLRTRTSKNTTESIVLFHSGLGILDACNLCMDWRSKMMECMYILKQITCKSNQVKSMK